MARDNIPLAAATEAGTTISPLAAIAANNAQYRNYNGRDKFVADNTAGGGSITVTVITGGSRGGLAIADRTITVGAGAKKRFGPYPPDDYNQSDGTLYIDVSGNIDLWAED